MHFSDKIKRSARRAKDQFQYLARKPVAEPPATTTTSSTALTPTPLVSSSLSIKDPANDVSGPSLHPTLFSPAPASAVSLVGSAPRPDLSNRKPGTAALESLPGAPAESTGEERTVGGIAWIGLKTLLRLLDRSADVFGPLKSAVDGVMGCIDIYERVGQGREDYIKLAYELDSLFADLTQYFEGPTSPAMTSSLESLAKGIENEVRFVQSKGQRNVVERIVQTNEDANEVLACYSRIQRLMQRLQLNTNVSLWKAVDEQTIENRLRNLLPSLSALYSSTNAATLRRGGCTPNTRVEVLKSLGNWAYGKESEKIYWLNGMAGTGKTTITYSLCDRLEDGLKLAASFFCSRQLPECRDPTLIFPTISYQLARFSVPFRLALSQAIERDPDVRIRQVPDQFRKLILEPLNAVRDSLPEDLVIVIDALDECENEDSVSQILEVLFSHSSNLPIKFFLTSRPEPQIRERMLSRRGERTRFELHLHDLDRLVVKEDIKTYLSEKLTKLNLTSADLERLTERSGALFIYAATVVRYLSYENFSMGSDRLRLVLGAPSLAKQATGKNSSPSSSEEELESPNDSEKEIDVLYITILRAGIEGLELSKAEKAQRKRILYAVVCAREPLTTKAIAGLLGLTSSSLVYRALQPLFSIINVSDKDELVTTMHESFPDYMRSPSRAGSFYCDPRKQDARLARRCFHLIGKTDPPFNICSLKSSYLFDEEVKDLEHRVERSISKELLYACKYWGAHLGTAESSQDLVDALCGFLEMRFLLWMEILNLKKCISIGASMLPKIQEWCREAGCPDDIRQLSQDGWSFITSYSSSPMSLSTPHIYVSALPFWPENRAISRCYMRQMQGLIEPTGSAMRVRRSAPLAICKSGGSVRAAAYSFDGTRIVSGSDDCTVRIWDAHTGQSIGHPLEGHNGTIRSVACSPDGTRIISGSDDRTVRIWDARTGQTIGKPLEGHTDTVNSINYSSDGTRIVSGSSDCTLRIWDAHTGKSIGKPIEGHNGTIFSVAYSPDGTRIVSSSFDHTVRIWDAYTGRRIGKPLEGDIDTFWSAAYSPDGTRIVSGSSDHTARIWDAHTGQSIGKPLKGHTDTVYSVAYSPDGTRIISGSSDCTVRIWDAHTGQSIGEPLEGHTDIVLAVAHSPDGTRIVSGSYDATVRIWDARTDQSVDKPLEGHGGTVFSIAYSPNGTHIVSGSYDRTVRIWDARTGQSMSKPLQGHTNTVYSIAYSPDGTRIISGSSDRTVRIWDARTGQGIGKPLQGHTNTVYSIAYSFDGTRIVSGSSDHTVRIWDAQTGQSIGKPLQGHTDKVCSVGYSPDGTRIISGSYDNTVRIWDAHTWQSTGAPLEGHTDVVWSVAYSPDGTRIISGSSDLTVRIWDAYTGQDINKPLKGHTNTVYSVSYSPDGTRIVSGSSDCTVRIWDGLTGQIIGEPLKGHTGTVHSVGYSPDGTYIVSSSLDRTIRTWVAHDDTRYLTAGPEHIHEHWVMNLAGWVVDDQSRLLTWVPPELRDKILRPPNATVISIKGSFNLDFSRARLGESWGDCYQLGIFSNSM